MRWSFAKLTFFRFFNFLPSLCRFRTTRRSESEAINGSIWRQSIFFFILTLHHCWPPAAVRSLRHGSALPSPSQLPASAWSKCAPRLIPATVLAFPTTARLSQEFSHKNKKVSLCRFSGDPRHLFEDWGRASLYGILLSSGELITTKWGVCLPLPPPQFKEVAGILTFFFWSPIHARHSSSDLRGPLTPCRTPLHTPHSRPAMLLQAVILLLLRCLASSLGQYDLCKSLVSTDDGSVWEHYACQPSPAPMKDYMRIKVDPPGITCGNPPERFCTLVSSLRAPAYFIFNCTLFFVDMFV